MEQIKETLEEAAERKYPLKGELEIHFYMVRRLAFIDGAKWQQEQDNKELAKWKLAVEKQEARCIALRGVISDLQEKMYSEEEVKQMLIDCCGEVYCEDGTLMGKTPVELYKWIDKQFKKKQHGTRNT
jgi:hypothetical protein